jgi:hypothetical protein
MTKRPDNVDSDVLIIGGSFGGVAAALTAAKMGKRVILTEETAWLGGQATTQGVPIDEHPWIEQYGCTRSYRKFRQLVRDYYATHYPLTHESRNDPFFNPGAGWVSGLGFEPRVGLAVIEQMLAPYRSSGLVTTHMRHRPVAATTEGDRIVSVTLVDTVSGEESVMSAPYILDATELGDVIELADVEHVIGAESVAETGEPSALDGPSDPLQQQGFTHLAAVDYRPGEDHTIEKPASYDKWRPFLEPWKNSMVGGMKGLFHPQLLNDAGEMVRSPDYRTCIWNFRRVLCRDNFVSGAFASDITMLMCGNEYKFGPLVGVPQEEADQHLRHARDLTLSLIYFLQTEVEPGYQGKPGFPGIRPRGDVFGTKDGLAPYPYIRESRRIKAEFTVKQNHFQMDIPGNENGPVLFDDSIGVGAYRIDLHEPAKGSQKCVTDALHGTSWPQQIPLGSLIPIRVENMIPACKNIGSTHITNGCFRLHCTEWNIGEAAGALAAYCLRHNLSPRNVRNNKTTLKDFQQTLQRLGVELEWPRMSFARSYASHYTRIPGWHGGESWRIQPC